MAVALSTAMIGPVQASALNAAHPSDQILQSLYLTVERDHVALTLDLSPGFLLAPELVKQVDSDGNGVLSEAEQRAYAAGVIDQISVSVDGAPAPLQVSDARFPALNVLGLGGTISLQAHAAVANTFRVVPSSSHALVVSNRYASTTSVYQASVLRPADPQVTIASQTRNEWQSELRVTYRTTGSSIMQYAPLLALVALCAAGLGIGAVLVRRRHLRG